MDEALRRPRLLIGAAAVFCLLVGQVATAGGSGNPGATTSASVAKQLKRLNRKVKRLQHRLETVSKQPGPQGPRGEQGPQGPEGGPGSPGQDAVKLFGYVRDGGSGATATGIYGSGIAAIDDPPGASGYRVRFDRSLVNCVVQATSGVGNPPGVLPLAAGARIPLVNMSAGSGDQVDVTFISELGAVVDTSFMITAIC